MPKGQNQEIRLSGRIISSGIAIGIACLEELNEEIPKHAISTEETDAELKRLEWARGMLQENLLEHILLAHSACDEDMENILKSHQIMLEVPSAVFLVQEILEEVDFVSVGTNDLLQYFTASDRDNPAVFPYHDPTNLAFIRLLRYLSMQIGSLNRLDDVTVCGEIASSPEMIPFLLDCGYRSLSISPVATEGVQKQISEYTLSGSCPDAIESGSSEEEN